MLFVILCIASLVEVQALQSELKQKEQQREELLTKLKVTCLTVYELIQCTCSLQHKSIETTARQPSEIPGELHVTLQKSPCFPSS